MISTIPDFDTAVERFRAFISQVGRPASKLVWVSGRLRRTTVSRDHGELDVLPTSSARAQQSRSQPSFRKLRLPGLQERCGQALPVLEVSRGEKIQSAIVAH